LEACLDPDAIADHDAAEIQVLVPAQSERLSVDLATGGVRGAHQPFVVQPGPLHGDDQLDGAGGAMQLEISGDRRLAVAAHRARRAGELRPRESWDVQEFRRHHVRVAFGGAGLDAGQVDPHPQARRADVVGIEGHLATPAAKATLNLADDDVAQRKLELRLVAFDLPTLSGVHVSVLSHGSVAVFENARCSVRNQIDIATPPAVISPYAMVGAASAPLPSRTDTHVIASNTRPMVAALI